MPTFYAKLCIFAVTITCSLGPLACEGQCPDNAPLHPTPATYRVGNAADPALIGATVSVTEEQITIKFERDGLPVTIVYDVGAHG